MPMGCASRRLAVLVATLLPATNLAAAPAPNPAAAVAAAAGHPAHRHLRAEANWSRDGQAGTATLETAGLQRLERECAGDLCSGAWFDGQHRWAFGINGTPWPEGGADAAERTFAAIASTAFGEPEFLATGGTVTALPDGGDAQLRYRVTAPRGTPLVAVADGRTRRLTGVESADRTLYRRLAASVAGPAIVYGARAYERITALEGAIVPPAGPAVSVAGPADLPLLEDVLPIVPCSLGARAARCLIDTGTTPSAVTLDFAERLGQEPRGRIEIAGLGTYLTGAIDAGPLLLGQATFATLRFAVIPRARGVAFDVVLGSDALAGLRVTFEAHRRRAGVAPPGDDVDGTPIALEFAGGLPFAQVRLGQRDRPEAMLVDTGDSELLSIGYDEYREDPGLFAARGASTATGLGGVPMDTVEGRLDRADVGGRPLSDLPVSAVRGQHIGHVGYGLARRCDALTLDLGRLRLICRTGLPDEK
jgi:hypothetical protein